MTKYYKVVNKNLRSICTDYMTSDSQQISIQYKINEWVNAPKCGNLPTKLFVFDDLETAIKFSKQYFGKVFRCEVTNPTEGFPCINYNEIKTYWRAFLDKIFHSKNVNFPTLFTSIPSILVSSVKLVEEI